MARCDHVRELEGEGGAGLLDGADVGADSEEEEGDPEESEEALYWRCNFQNASR